MNSRNYFFVHTPFQLLIAEFLCTPSFKTSHNTLFITTTSLNRTRQLMIMRKMLSTAIWNEVIEIDELSELNPSLKSFISFTRAGRKICNITNQIKKPSNVFFGDLNHPSYLNIALNLKSSNLHFFEDGLAHYSLPIFKKKKIRYKIIKRKLYSLFAILTGLPVKMTKILYSYENINPESLLKVKRRYNLLDRSDDEISVDLKIDNIRFRDFLIEKSRILVSYVKSFQDVSIILLGTTLASTQNIELIYFNAISTIRLTNEKKKIYIKFHPKEDPIVCKNLITVLNTKNLNVEQLKIPSELPIELFIVINKIDLLASFGSSTSAYLFLLSPSTKLLDLSQQINRKHRN